jgi:hypothetical protein
MPVYDFLEAFNEIFRSFNGSSFSITLNGLGSGDKYSKFTDSTSMDFYSVSFERKKDEDIYHYKNSLIGISVASKNKANKVKSVDLDFDADMTVFDINYREDKAGNLYVFGKYIIKGEMKSRYGMYSVIYDKELSQKTSLKYFELNSFYNFTNTVPNEKYIGFIFTKLHNADYEFYLEEEEMFLFTYQKSFTNLQDHIYLLRVESSGEVTVSRIVNRLDNETKYGNERHMALRAGNKLHFLFYDHKDNIGKDVSDLEYKVGDIEKKKCVLMSSTYSVEDNDFTKKKLIADKKTLKYLPHLVAPVIHFDAGSNQYVCLLRGRKKYETVLLYQFFYTAE